MKEDNSRRRFIKRMSALGSLAILSPKTGFSMENSEQKVKSPVTNIKALGFQWETQDPFLFCVHHEDFYPAGNEKMGPKASLEGRHLGQDFIVKDGWRMYHGKEVPGFPGHPHRGFETITVVRTGMVDHSDSLGGAGRYGNGDVQWMTAGKGVQHAEMFPCIHQDKENPLELFQIWLNLPQKNKFVEPHYKMLWNETIPKIDLEDENGRKIYIEVIAGSIGDHTAQTPPPDSWAASNENEVGVYYFQLDPHAKFMLPKSSADVNRTLYFFKGNKLKVADKTLENYHSAELQAEGDVVIEAGDDKAYVLILQGKPINEPVVQHGPFVMNTRQEIQDAFHDYQETLFGGWPWPTYANVHSADKGRFALHADGTLEDKS